ncbi:hypothetical protein [Falsigemmobacter faecalis]|uniref:Uncharacterized protein n=1 Tax=Falsigemmobacter faecalis TaxID=2488730 RepID=A0A3P3DH06_9RHOB|nr:hypothetical protein [Falsigemmobacter faecalis]RRH73545.1 hypothetical protein EG244_12760 [Falsigemmobacter faecalis]
MARFNRWQNHLLLDCLDALPVPRLRGLLQAREGAFGDLLSRALVSDLIWMRRLEQVPEVLHPALAEGLALVDFAAWRRERQSVDALLVAWSARQGAGGTGGQLYWYAAESGRVVSQPLGLCLTQIFWSQGEARGRITEHLLGAGVALSLPDLLSLPEDAEWMA